MVIALVLFLSLFLLVNSNLSDLIPEKFNINHLEVYYQLPKNNNNPKGIVVLFHGCGHSATDWWPKSDKCTSCIGLPEEVAIVEYGLSLNYAMMAITSSNREHKCWQQVDIYHSTEVIKGFYDQIFQGNNSIPLHLIGASSGGGFAGFLAETEQLQPKVASLCVQISPMYIKRPKHNPPVIFIVMERDVYIHKMVVNIATLLPNSKILIAHPRIIANDYFYKYSKGIIDEESSKKIAEALKKAGMLNEKNMLITDPRKSGWRKVSNS
jgi:hypothetical protein